MNTTHPMNQQYAMTPTHPAAAQPHAQAPQYDTQAQKFAEMVEVRVTTKGFLTNQEEMQLLEEGIRNFHLSLAEARGVVHSVADRQGVPIEREVERTLQQWMKAAAGRRRKLSKGQFEQAAQVYQKQANGELAAVEVKRRVKRMMEEMSIEPRRAGLLRTRRWYKRIAV